MSCASKSCKSFIGPAVQGRCQRRFAVIIVHYNTPEMLRECLAALLPELDEGRDEVIVVDNASDAACRDTLRTAGQWPMVTVLEAGRNLGFAGGNNVAIRHVLATGGAEYFVLLNADTLVRPGALAILLRFLEEQREV